MVIDTSALLAIFFLQAEARRFTELIRASDRPRLSVANLLETSILIQSRKGLPQRDRLDAFLADGDVVIEPVTRSQCLIARDAHHRFGKGNHPAKLNFGDCFAYALAKERDLPLLFKGDDFSFTDIGRRWVEA
jgi:ribonuclease VapC